MRLRRTLIASCLAVTCASVLAPGSQAKRATPQKQGWYTSCRGKNIRQSEKCSHGIAFVVDQTGKAILAFDAFGRCVGSARVFSHPARPITIRRGKFSGKTVFHPRSGPTITISVKARFSPSKKKGKKAFSKRAKGTYRVTNSSGCKTKKRKFTAKLKGKFVG